MNLALFTKDSTVFPSSGLLIFAFNFVSGSDPLVVPFSFPLLIPPPHLRPHQGVVVEKIPWMLRPFNGLASSSFQLSFRRACVIVCAERRFVEFRFFSESDFVEGETYTCGDRTLPVGRRWSAATF